MKKDPDAPRQEEFRARGAITRIRIQNFMTYDDTELRPGPNLNMILGPNGTGKSAVVCCIIVGLAGEVSLTGRGGSPADFVKKDRDWGITEIELHNDSGANYVVERKISIQGRTQFKIDHKSEWKINKKVVNKAEVQKLTKHLNIKVDNLCQFLPQDSVTQFVKMNPKELLLNTLKAAGDNQLVEDHQKLVEQTKDVEKMRVEREKLLKQCEENEVNVRRLESEVTQIRQREQLVRQRQLCSQKIHYVRFLEAQKVHKEAQDKRNKLKGDLAAIEATNEPFRRAVEHHKKEELRLGKLVEESKNQVKSVTNLINNTQNSIENCKVDCQEQFAKFKGKQDQEKSRESSIRLKQQELDSYECKLNELRDVDCTKQIDNVYQDMQEKQRELMKTSKLKNDRKQSIQTLLERLDLVKREREQIETSKKRKVDMLRAKFPPAYKVLEWLAKNQNKFKKRVFHPIMCEINVKEPRYSRIVEHAIPKQEQCAFVCQSAEDLSLLTRSVRDELKMRINVILAPEKTVEEYEFEASQHHDYRNIGVIGYLKDLIDAPPPIMSYLCNSHNFHRIPVAEDSEQKLKQLLDRCPRFYIGNQFYNVSKSRYDGRAVTVSDFVREASLLLVSMDVKRLEKCSTEYKRLSDLLEQAKKEHDDKMAEEGEIKAKWQSLSEKHRELNNKQNERKTLETLIKKKQEELRRLREEKIDLDAEKLNLQKAIERINGQIVTYVAKLVKIYRDSVSFKKRLMINLVLSKLAGYNYRLAQKKLANSERDTTRLKEEVRQSQSLLDEAKNDLESRAACAEEKIPGFNKGQLDSRTSKKFKNIKEESLDALINLREELKIQVERIHKDSGNSIINEYNKQNEDLLNNRKLIAELESSLGQADTDRGAIKNNWLPRLEEVIKVINENYRAFMRKLLYDGEVRLDFNRADPDDFASYGVMILVKYRDKEDLIPLSSTRQSGGERSVATMIYMLALQTKTTVPFRCVDEINQGMDKENERKVFELLVKTADSSSSQYFLVSPKLLSNLPYSEKMKIHVVFNGKNLKIAWNKQRFAN